MWKAQRLRFTFLVIQHLHLQALYLSHVQITRQLLARSVFWEHQVQCAWVYAQPDLFHPDHSLSSSSRLRPGDSFISSPHVMLHCFLFCSPPAMSKAPARHSALAGTGSMHSLVCSYCPSCCPLHWPIVRQQSMHNSHQLCHFHLKTMAA